MDSIALTTETAMPAESNSTSSPNNKFTLIFTAEDRPGALDDAIQLFKTFNISLKHIESRPSKTFEWVYDFLIEFEVKDVNIAEKVCAELS